MSFRKYALTAVFAATVGVGGTMIAEDRYIEHKMATGQPCDVYKNVTKWMDRYSPPKKEGAKDTAAISYDEETLGDKEVKVCSATAGEAHGQELVKLLRELKQLF